jgi:hypothetical protein
MQGAALDSTSLSHTLARALDGVKANVEKAFKVTINANGSIFVHTSSFSPAQSYTNYFQLPTNTLNNNLPVGDNKYNVFQLAPSTYDYITHNFPVYVLTEDTS